MSDGYRIFSFDMDGTLLPGTTGLLELAKTLGTVSELKKLEKQFSSGQLDTVMFTKKISSLWGTIEDSTARLAFDNAPKLTGISEVVRHIREIGGVSCVVTMSQDVFANFFLDFGFDYVFATPYPPHNANDFAKVLTPADKVSVLKCLSQTHNLRFEHTVAFGDSLSDVELFSQVNHSIAVNGDQYIRDQAAFSYSGNSLLEAFRSSTHLWTST